MPVRIIDLNEQRFRSDRYGDIAELREQSPYSRTPDGAVVFFDHADVTEVLRCVDFRFAFNQIDIKKSAYLTRAIEHELLNMHGDAHKRLSRLLKKRFVSAWSRACAGRLPISWQNLSLASQPTARSIFAAPLPTDCGRECWGRSTASPQNRRRVERMDSHRRAQDRRVAVRHWHSRS